MDALQEVIINGAISIITVLIGIGVTALKKWLDAKRVEIEIKQGKENLDIVDKVAKSTVNYVEQVFQDVNGTQKLMRALVAGQKTLSEQGVDISDEQLRIFIESAIKEANEKWHAPVELTLNAPEIIEEPTQTIGVSTRPTNKMSGY